MFARVSSLTAAAIYLFSAGTAGASTVSLYFESVNGSPEGTDATATVTMSFTDQGAEDWLTLEIWNTTAESYGSQLTAIGFELPDAPPFSVAFAPGGTSVYFDTVTLDVNVSPSWLDAPGGYDVMTTGDGSYEGGSPAGAPAAGETQTVVLNLGDTGLTPEGLCQAFESFYMGMSEPYAIARFQSVGPNGENSDKMLGIVPEPASLGLLIAGLAAMSRRRRRR